LYFGRTAVGSAQKGPRGRNRSTTGDTDAQAVFLDLENLTGNGAFSDLKRRQIVLVFELVRQDDGRHWAEKVSVFDSEAR
jgi:hypothetical protein